MVLTDDAVRVRGSDIPPYHPTEQQYNPISAWRHFPLLSLSHTHSIFTTHVSISSFRMF